MSLLSGAKPAGATPSAIGGGGGGPNIKVSNITASLQQYGGMKLKKSAPDKPKKQTVLLKGDKDASKTCALYGLPRYYGGKIVYISFDKTTLESLLDYYGREPFDQGILDVWEVCRPVHEVRDKAGKEVPFEEMVKRVNAGEDQANFTVKETYPGFDPNRPETAEIVLATTMGILEQYEREGGVDVLIADHWQRAHEKVGKTFAFHKNKRDPSESLEYQEWNPRSHWLGLIFTKMEQIPRCYFGLTGYGEEEDTMMVPDLNKPKKANGEHPTKVVKAIKTPSWLKEYKIDIHAVLHAGVTVEASTPKDRAAKATAYHVTVEMSKDNLTWPKGQTFDITGSNVKIIFEGIEERKKNRDLFKDDKEE